MAKIEVKDIKSNGAELFDDSEGFMDELNEDIFQRVKGGTLASYLDTTGSVLKPTFPLSDHKDTTHFPYAVDFV